MNVSIAMSEMITAHGGPLIVISCSFMYNIVMTSVLNPEPRTPQHAVSGKPKPVTPGKTEQPAIQVEEAEEPPSSLPPVPHVFRVSLRGTPE